MIFPRLRQLLERVSIWSKSAFFSPKGYNLLTSLNLLEDTRNEILLDLGKLVSNPGNVNRFIGVGFPPDVLLVIEDFIRGCDEKDLLKYYSHKVLPQLSAASAERAGALKSLLSLLFSCPATQVSCERLFSKASAAYEPIRSSMNDTTLQAIITVQKVFPNSIEGILSGLNAIRRLRVQLNEIPEEVPNLQIQTTLLDDDL